jgi:hypothetical protein
LTPRPTLDAFVGLGVRIESSDVIWRTPLDDLISGVVS